MPQKLIVELYTRQLASLFVATTEHFKQAKKAQKEEEVEVVG